MKSKTTWILCITLLGGLAALAWAEQTMLKAYAPAHSDGTSIIVEIDWAQVRAAAPEADHISLRRRTAAPPVVEVETIVALPADSGRYLDTGLDPALLYHYYAYVKDADSTTLKFGGFPSVLHLGPIRTQP